MRLKFDQPEAKDIAFVLLDGKPVPNWYEADDKEEWVDSCIPILPNNAIKIEAGETVEVDNEKEELPEISYKIVRRKGWVKFLYTHQLKAIAEKMVKKSSNEP